MFLHHRKAIWNLVIMKCCTFYENFHYNDLMIDSKDFYFTITYWAQGVHYKNYPGTYARARLTSEPTELTGSVTKYYEVIYWNLGIDGNQFPKAAIDELFIDDTPGHIINPNGLFHRAYVFQQFSKKKYDDKHDFRKAHELGNSRWDEFNGQDDWNFTGGMFPQLTEQ